MDRYCPECNSTMTPSLVGYLCPDCGHMQRFYTMTGTQLQSTSLPVPKSTSGVDDVPKDKLPKLDQANEKIDTGSETARNDVRSTLKRLMVPELPPAHDHGEPAKVKSESAISTEGRDVFENYDDLIDTTVEDAESTDKPTEPVAAKNTPEQAAPISDKHISAIESKTKKHLPVWVWILSGIIIFLSTALILLLIIVT